MKIRTSWLENFSLKDNILYLWKTEHKIYAHILLKRKWLIHVYLHVCHKCAIKIIMHKGNINNSCWWWSSIIVNVIFLKAFIITEYILAWLPRLVLLTIATIILSHVQNNVFQDIFQFFIFYSYDFFSRMLKLNIIFTLFLLIFKLTLSLSLFISCNISCKSFDDSEINKNVVSKF